MPGSGLRAKGTWAMPNEETWALIHKIQNRCLIRESARNALEWHTNLHLATTHKTGKQKKVKGSRLKAQNGSPR